MAHDYTTLSACRMCGGSQLSEFLDLGHQPLANSFLKETDLNKPEPVYPLRVLFCNDCNLVQLGEVVDPKVMFWDYLYFSGGMPAGKHWRDYAKSIAAEFIANPDDLLVEIGSNDGHFLKVVKESHPRILGIDPAQNIAKLANEHGIPTIPKFFSHQLAKEIRSLYGTAKVIVGNNVVAHIYNHHDLFEGIKELLAPDGVFVFEAPYLADMIENLTFDTIYHEHLSYLAMQPLKRLFDRFGLEAFRVEVYPIQGTSIRVFVSHKNTRPLHDSVEQLVQKELGLKMHQLSAYQQLAQEIHELKQEVTTLVEGLKRQGRRLAGYGASAKGNTVLNFFGIDSRCLEFVTEALPSKIGLYTPGTHILVKHIEEARKNPPDYYLLLAWNYQDVILEQEKEFREQGGKFIMPVGKKRII